MISLEILNTWKNKENIDGLLGVLYDYLDETYPNNDIVLNKQNDIKKSVENAWYTKETWILILWILKYIDLLDFFVFYFNSTKNEEKSISFLKTIAKIWQIVPISRFSIQEFLYKKFEKSIDDKYSEIDNYKHRNSSIISMIISSVSAIGAIVAIWSFSQYVDIFYWFLVFLFLVFYFYLIDFVKNLISMRKNMYIISSIQSLVEPFDEPVKNINSEYIKYIRLLLSQIQDYRKSRDIEIDYKKAAKNLNLFMSYRTWKRFRFAQLFTIDILKTKFLTIIFLVLYFIIAIILQERIIIFLTQN